MRPVFTYRNRFLYNFVEQKYRKRQKSSMRLEKLNIKRIETFHFYPFL